MNPEKVIIIGAGFAALAAAIRGASRGRDCLLVSQTPAQRAQSNLAEGGINAALNTMGEGDSPALHAQDTLRSAAGLVDPLAVRALTEAAPEVVGWLCRLGVPFAAQGQELLLRPFGGQTKKRTAFVRCITGKAIMNALIDEARRYELRKEGEGRITPLSHHELADLLVGQDHVCRGCVVRDTRTGSLLTLRGPVILATGGLNGFFSGLTTGAIDNRGDASAIAFARGAVMGNLEMIQYHPTTVGIAGKRLLVSEAARAEGGRLLALSSSGPSSFMESADPAGDLAPRDVISRAMAQLLQDDPQTKLCLDLRGIPDAIWESRLPELRAQLQHRLHLDPRISPVPIAPGIHYFMGGLLVDREHRTSIRNLYAAGECACQYHGANRLGGNSILGALFGGQTAMETILAHRTPLSPPADIEGTTAAVPFMPLTAEDLPADRQMREILLSCMSILRSGPSLEQAAAELQQLREQLPGEGHSLLGARLALAQAMVLSALARKESRGAHNRTDYPDRDPFLKRITAAAHAGDGPARISFSDTAVNWEVER